MSRAEIKYVVAPGWVRSQHDGELHYISAERLVRLYGVSRDECVIEPRLRLHPPSHLIRLTPRVNGDYTVPA